MTSLLIASLLIAAHDPSLNLPPRSPTAATGREFARAIIDLPLKEREERILVEILSGNVPQFHRTFVTVTITKGGMTARFDVAPDYLAVGSDEDYVLMPLTPQTAQVIADRLDCTLPTPRMVDAIRASATLKMIPSPIAPSPAMTTMPVFLRHSELVLARRNGAPPGALVAGHKKDIVVANRAFLKPGKVAIYGWHDRDGKPIQPLYIGHAASWVDYSHGIRLVRRSVSVDDQNMAIEDCLADPRLAPLFSDDGPMPQTRYPLAAAPGERVDWLRFDKGVKVAINRPEILDTKPVLLVFYGLPNGNTIEQTFGKRLELWSTTGILMPSRSAPRPGSSAKPSRIEPWSSPTSKMT